MTDEIRVQQDETVVLIIVDGNPIELTPDEAHKLASLINDAANDAAFEALAAAQEKSDHETEL